MNIYLVARTPTWDYDDFDSFIVVAENEEEARYTHPYYNHDMPIQEEEDWNNNDVWVPKENVNELKVTLIGKAAENYKIREIICASFNAG